GISFENAGVKGAERIGERPVIRALHPSHDRFESFFQFLVGTHRGENARSEHDFVNRRRSPDRVPDFPGSGGAVVLEGETLTEAGSEDGDDDVEKLERGDSVPDVVLRSPFLGTACAWKGAYGGFDFEE